MKKNLTKVIFILLCSICCCAFAACNSNANWRETDIHGYYTGYGWQLILREEMDGKTNTFIVWYTADEHYKNAEIITEINFKVFYGCYTISEIYEEDDYVEYHLDLTYFSDDTNAPQDTLSIIVKSDTIHTAYSRSMLYYKGDILK